MKTHPTIATYHRLLNEVNEIERKENSMTDDELDPEPKTFDAGYVGGLRQECARYRLDRNAARTEIEELTGKLEAFKSGPSPEVEAAKARVADLELKLSQAELAGAELETKSRVIEEAFKLGFTEPEAAYEHIDLAEINEDPASVKKALMALIKTNPELTTPEPVPPTPGISNHPSVPLKRKLTANEEMLAFLQSGLNR